MPVTAHHAVAIVDLDSAPGRPVPAGDQARTTLRQMLAAAAAHAGLRWEALRAEDRGNGVLLVPDQAVAQAVLAGALVTALDAQLLQQPTDTRMRVAVDLGPVVRDDGCWTGDAVATAFRLVDAPLLGRVLDRAERARTAVAVSDRFFTTVVRRDSLALDPAVFAPTAVDDEDELPALTAWVRVPGYAGPPGVERRAAPQRSTPDDAARAAHPQPPVGSAVHGSIINIAGSVRGDVIGGDKYSFHEGR